MLPYKRSRKVKCITVNGGQLKMMMNKEWKRDEICEKNSQERKTKQIKTKKKVKKKNGKNERTRYS